MLNHSGWYSSTPQVQIETKAVSLIQKSQCLLHTKRKKEERKERQRERRRKEGMEEGTKEGRREGGREGRCSRVGGNSPESMPSWRGASE